MRHLFTFLWATLLSIFTWQAAIGQNPPDTLAPMVFATTGGFATNSVDSISLSYTMGELLTQTSVTLNGTLVLTQGFQQPERQELVGIFVPPPVTVDYKAFPNPTAGELTLQLNGEDPTLIFAGIYDLRGRMTVVPEQRLGFVGSFETLFDLTPLPEGMYILRLYDEDRQLLESLKIQKSYR